MILIKPIKSPTVFLCLLFFAASVYSDNGGSVKLYPLPIAELENVF